MSIGKILGIVAAIPAVMFALVQIYLAVTMGRVAWQVEKTTRPEQARKDAFPFQVENTKLKGRYTQPGFLALSNQDQFHTARTVSVSIPLKVRDLLQPGETAPDADSEEVFVKARAVNLANAECGLLQQELASQCKVTGSHVRAYQGQYTLQVTMQFVQRADFFPALMDGSAKVDGVQYSYQEMSRQLALKPTGDRAMVSQMARLRAKFYARAARQCDSLRSREGNCAVQNINLSTRADRKSSAYLLQGSVRLSWLDMQPVA